MQTYTEQCACPRSTRDHLIVYCTSETGLSTIHCVSTSSILYCLRGRYHHYTVTLVFEVSTLGCHIPLSPWLNGLWMVRHAVIRWHSRKVAVLEGWYHVFWTCLSHHIWHESIFSHSCKSKCETLQKQLHKSATLFNCSKQTLKLLWIYKEYTFDSLSIADCCFSQSEQETA